MRGIFRNRLFVWESELDVFTGDVEVGVLSIMRQPGRSPSEGLAGGTDMEERETYHPSGT